MSEKIAVPEALVLAIINQPDRNCGFDPMMVRKDLAVVLRWISCHGHTLLNDDQLKELHDEWHSDSQNSGKHFYRWVIREALRRMFVVSEVDPLVMYIMRHFADTYSHDGQQLLNRAEAAVDDWKEHIKRNAPKGE